MFYKMPVLLGQIKKTKALQLMLLPGLIYYLVFHYAPIYGLVIAFKDFNLRLGILGSKWIGWENFKRFFNYVYFFRLVKNTFVLNLYSLLWGFPMPIILALFLNEVKNLFFKRFVQTVSYLPHFISTVAVVGMLYMILSPSTGIVNRIITALGGGDRSILLPIRPGSAPFISAQVYGRVLAGAPLSTWRL
jgi:putative aldouronate transport system permease protein